MNTRIEVFTPSGVPEFTYKKAEMLIPDEYVNAVLDALAAVSSSTETNQITVVLTPEVQEQS